MVIVMENIIRIHLKDKLDYINTFNEKILSYELSNYILEETRGINTKQNIKFIISKEFEMTDDDKENLVDMIRNNFGADISEIMNFSSKQLIGNVLIFLIGLIFLIIYSIFSKIMIISDFILILGWVLLGETICNFLYKGIENKLKIAKRKQIVNAKVIFEEDYNINK